MEIVSAKECKIDRIEQFIHEYITSRCYPYETVDSEAHSHHGHTFAVTFDKLHNDFVAGPAERLCNLIPNLYACYTK